MPRAENPLGMLHCVSARDKLAHRALAELSSSTANPELVWIAGSLGDVRPMLTTLEELVAWAHSAERSFAESRCLSPVEGSTQFYRVRAEPDGEAATVLSILSNNLLGNRAPV